MRPTLRLDITKLPESIRALAEHGEPRHYRKSTVVMHEGDTGESLLIIISGKLRVYSASDSGREITYGIYGAGEYIGEMSLDGGLRSASVVTLESTDCILIHRQTLLRHIAACPEFAMELLAKVIRRARAATLSAKQLALNDVYGRLSQLLDELAVSEPDGERIIEDRLTHRDISNRLGCSREMISRLMKDLERGGYIEASEQRLILRRPLPARW